MDLKNRVPGFFEKGRFKTSKKKKKSKKQPFLEKNAYFLHFAHFNCSTINTRFVVKFILFPILSHG